MVPSGNPGSAMAVISALANVQEFKKCRPVQEKRRHVSIDTLHTY
jgi:hypothetical protein